VTAAEPPEVRRSPGWDSLRAWTLFPAGFLTLIAIACVVVYFPALNGPFVFDDVNNIVENPHVRMTKLDLSSIRRAMAPYGPLNLRPLSFLTFALNHLFDGYNPFGYHVFNLAVLLLSIPAAYLLALHLGNAWLRPREARATALGATALWVLHPLLTNGVSYVVQRMTALYALFSLATLLFLVRGRLSGRPGPYALAGVSLLCALASKETALFTPLLAVLILWLLPREAGGAGPRAGWALAGLIAASQGATLLATEYALRATWIPAQAFGTAERLMTEGRVVLRYLELFLLPLPSKLTLDYAFPLSTSLLTPPSTLLAAAFHVALIASAFRVRQRRPLLAFGILAFYLLQLPEGTFMPLDLIFEHRAYLPAFFLSLALMDLLLWGIGRRGALAVAVLLGALWGGFGYQRNQTWTNPVKLWEDTVAKAPGNSRAQTNLGQAYLDLGNPEKAFGYLREAVRLNPRSVFALVNLGSAHVESGNPEKGLEYLQEAVRLQPDYAVAHNNLGAAYMELENLRQAVECLQEAIRLKPDYIDALYNLGKTHLALGNPQEALGSLQEAVRLKPTDAEALNDLGKVYGMLERPAESLECFRRAIAAKRNYAEAHFNLGIALLKLGRDAEATTVWRALQRIDPALAQSLGSQIPGTGG
jgi:tetratricopeptide (TPR) repeat protein